MVSVEPADFICPPENMMLTSTWANAVLHPSLTMQHTGMVGVAYKAIMAQLLSMTMFCDKD